VQLTCPGAARWYNPRVLSALVQLLILFVLVVVLPIVVWEARKRYQEQQLRANPHRQVVFELRVPREVVDANTRMMDVWANLRSAFDPSVDDRKQGMGKVTFMFDFEGQGSTKAPTLRCFMYCDKESEALVKRTITSGFKAGDVELRKVPASEDPRRRYMKLLREQQMQKAEVPADE
jgi:hypothetical protein